MLRIEGPLGVGGLCVCARPGWRDLVWAAGCMGHKGTHRK